MRPAFPALWSILLLLTSMPIQAQETTDDLPRTKSWYTTGSGEWVFSVPVLDVNGSDRGSVVRFAPVVNLQWVANYDLSPHFGTFVGASLRNLGFIHDVPDSVGSPVDVRYKYRSYTLGVPVGLKVGRMNKALFFAGYELELPFAYKEKRFENGDRKERSSAWFSQRTEPLFHSVMFGIQGAGGTTLKFKYYLTNFHNKDFTEKLHGVESAPYAGLNANLVTVSLSVDLFRGSDFAMKRRQGRTTDP